MKTLFLKSNLLHIRLKEGEYEVSNPDEKVGDITPWLFFYRGGKKWPYGVELVDACPDKGNLLVCANESCWDLEECQHKKVARLIPEEKKTLDELRDSAIKGLTEIRDKIQNHLGDSFTESAYKEGEKDQYGNPVFDTPEEEAEYRKKALEMANRIIDGLSVNKANFEHIAQTGKINGSLRQELIDKIFAKLPVSAPSESQEGDLWQELAEIINSEPEERITGNTLAALSTKFTITRKPE